MRTSRWSSLLLIMVGVGLPLVFALMYALAVPFKENIIYLNRRTGEDVYVQKTYGVITSDSAKADYRKLSRFGELTAADVRVLRYTNTIRFPGGGSVSKEQHPGEDLFILSCYMFNFQEPDALKDRPVPAELIDKLMRERVMVWNTTRIENETQALITYYQDENKRLLPPRRKSAAAGTQSSP